MSFDPQSLDRLKELGRKLPQALPTPLSSSQDKISTSRKLHPVETEEDPKVLFHELINISPDGTIPPHLMQRLKEIEDRESTKQNLYKNKTCQTPKQPKNDLLIDQNNESEQDLYSNFKQLLLEEEEI